jgi:hypothetical protein
MCSLASTGRPIDSVTQRIVNAKVHMFWHGAPLSRLERLSLASFVAHRHPVDLYVYDDVGTVPNGVQLCDANQVLPQKYIFRHRRSGSLGLFADWLRYRLLAQHGGIWADLDMVCLRPLDYSATEIYAWENARQINNAILGLPAHHPVAQWLAQCCEYPNRALPYDSLKIRLRKWHRRFLRGNRRDNIGWAEYGPKGLTAALRYFRLDTLALPSWHFYPVSFDQGYSLFQSTHGQLPAWLQQSYAVHFSNTQLLNRGGFDKNQRFPADSIFEQLWQRYC